MSIGRATALSLGFICAVALGIAISPYVLDRDAGPVPAARPTASSEQRPSSAAATVARTSEPVPRIRAAEPALQKRLKGVLNQGMNMEIAAEGFRSGEQFAAVAHAARNTGAPFMVLKDRVVAKRMSLTAALRDVKPDTNASAEANRAYIMARADIAAVSG